MIDLPFSALGGVDIFVLPPERRQEQFRFPRSKRKRIRKKWRGDPRNWRWVAVRRCFLLNGALYVDPLSFEDLKRNIGGAL